MAKDYPVHSVSGAKFTNPGLGCTSQAATGIFAVMYISCFLSNCICSDRGWAVILPQKSPYGKG